MKAQYIHTQQQVAVLFTKALSKGEHIILLSKLGV